MKTSTLNYYAIKVGDKVELRAASRRPKAIKSSLTKVTIPPKRPTLFFDEDMGIYRTEIRQGPPQKVIMKQVFYVGGRVLGVVTGTTFLLYATFNLKANEMREVPRDIVIDCLKRRIV